MMLHKSKSKLLLVISGTLNSLLSWVVIVAYIFSQSIVLFGYSYVRYYSFLPTLYLYPDNNKEGDNN